MALRVWLPLINDIHNQGASNITLTNTSATFTTGGKIGNVIQFGTAKSYLKINDVAELTTMTECSISLWIKILTWNTSYATYFQLGLGSTPWAHYIFGLLRNNTASTLCFTISNGSSATNANCLTPALDLNTWYHLTFTYSTGHCKVYVNGVETKDYTTTIVPNFAGITTGTIGACNNGNNYQTNCLMNDFRIYDHCLSAAEVKEISQGLVLHYKLDRIPTTITNAYNMTSWNTNATRGGFSAWGPSGHSGTSGNNTDRNYIYRNDRTYSYYISEDAGTGKYFIFYQSPAFEGGYRSLSAIIKEQNGIPIDETVCVPSWNANVTGSNHAPLNIWTHKISLGNGFYLCQVDGFYQDGSNDLVSINVLPGYKIYISEIWLEDDKQISSDVLFPSEQVEDSSGYGNNGIINSNPTMLSETMRYNCSISFDGVDDCIKIPFNNIIKDKNYTVSVWTYKTSIGTKNYQTILGGPSGFELEARSSSSTSPLYRIHNWGGGTTAYEFNKWNLFTFVHTDSNSKLYVNGELKITGTSANIPTGNYYIGAWNSVTGQNYEGLMSDFRIYCTALDADVIRQLYEVGAKVDNKGNLHTFELNETNINLLSGIPWCAPFSSHTPLTSPFTNYNSNGEPQFTSNGASAGTGYIEISPTGHTYEYDYTISVNAGNQFYIGFERYDANKTARSNNACVYTFASKPSSNIVKQHYTGTINLATDGTNPCKYIALRILNGWSGTTSGVTGNATIHSISLRQIGTKQQPEITKTGLCIGEELKEETNTKLHKNGIIETNNLIEL